VLRHHAGAPARGGGAGRPWSGARAASAGVRGKIIAEFKIEKVRIAGIQVYKGEISKGDPIHLKRDDKIIKDTKVEGIRNGKNILDKVKASTECGMTFKPYVDFKINDVIISYKTDK
jgi:translation initiation factor IF-2